MPEQGKTLGQSDSSPAMEALEFLVALLVVLTFPDARGNKKSSNTSQYETMHKQKLSAKTVEEGSLFKIAGMWIDKEVLLKR